MTRRAPALRYTAAVGFTLLALLVTTQLHGLLDSGSFMVFLSAVVVSAAFGGLGPGLIATALSIASIDFFFLAPTFSLRLIARADVILLGVYALAAVGSSYVAESLRAARQRAEENAEKAAALARLFERNMGELQKDVSAAALRDDLTSGRSSPDQAAYSYSRRRLPS